MIWLKVLIIVVLVIFVLFCLFSIWHSGTHFRKERCRYFDDKIKEPVKLVFLTDLHDMEYGEGNSKLIKAIEEEDPDAVLVTGDMLTAGENRTVKVAERLIERLAEKYPVYYSLGNHEAKLSWDRARYGQRYEAYIEEISAAGAKVLRNEFIQLGEHQIRIYGLDMEQIYYKRFKKAPMDDDYLAKKLGRLDDYKYFNILLAHNPMYFEKYAKWKPEIVLSGHVHGGLIRLPILGGVIAPNLQLFPKYDGGRFFKEQSVMVLSRGLGFHSVEFRMWNPGELHIIELYPHKMMQSFQ